MVKDVRSLAEVCEEFRTYICKELNAWVEVARDELVEIAEANLKTFDMVDKDGSVRLSKKQAANSTGH